jgi:dolichyl-phosphate-mannose-protein mannosyltransferase
MPAIIPERMGHPGPRARLCSVVVATREDFWADGGNDEALAVRGTRTERYARPRSSRRLRVWLILAVVTALAGGLRLYHLSSPHAYVFDETYYAKDGCFDAGFPYKDCGLKDPGEQTFTVHPPLGRWIIAGGEAAFGNRPFGWRIASAVFGTASVLLAALLALQMFDNPWWAGVAGVLVATEGLNLVQSRVSMLDIFVTAFVLAGFLFMVLDRKWIERRTPAPSLPSAAEPLALPRDRVPSPLVRPWRMAAGVAFGAASASKWSGLFALVGAVVLAFLWERSRRKRARARHPLWEAVRDESFGIVVAMLIVPLAVYMLSYLRWWVDNGVDLGAWWRVQTGMLDYSIHLRATHPYASRPWTWMFLMRPVSYYYECTGHIAGACSQSAEILALGNPLIFWGSFITIPYVVVAGFRRRDWVAGLLILAFAIQYVPWFFAARTSFLFYMTPVTPFMVLALVYVLGDLSSVRVGDRGGTLAPAAVGIVIVALLVSAFLWPVLVGRPISQQAWQDRVPLSCQSHSTWCWNWV